MPGHPLEQLAGDRCTDVPCPDEANGDLAWVRLRVGDEVGDRAGGRRDRHRHDVRVVADQRHRREVADRIVGQRREQEAIDGERHRLRAAPCSRRVPSARPPRCRCWLRRRRGFRPPSAGPTCRTAFRRRCGRSHRCRRRAGTARSCGRSGWDRSARARSARGRSCQRRHGAELQQAAATDHGVSSSSSLAR